VLHWQGGSHVVHYVAKERAVSDEAAHGASCHLIVTFVAMSTTRCAGVFVAPVHRLLGSGAIAVAGCSYGDVKHPLI
jgi:hypothetical protein